MKWSFSISIESNHHYQYHIEVGSWPVLLDLEMQKVCGWLENENKPQCPVLWDIPAENPGKCQLQSGNWHKSPAVVLDHYVQFLEIKYRFCRGKNLVLYIQAPWGKCARWNYDFFGCALIQPSSLLSLCSPCLAEIWVWSEGWRAAGSSRQAWVCPSALETTPHSQKEKSASSWSSTCHLCGQSVLTAVNCQTYPKSLGTFPPSVFLRDLCQEGRVGEKSCHVQIPCCLLPSLLPTMILEMNLFQARWNLCLLFFRLEWHFIRLFPKIRIIFGPWWAWSCRCVHCWVWLLLQRCCRNVLRENVIILGKICVWAVSVWCWEKDWAFLK